VADGDSEFRIKVAIDSSDASSGAADTVADIDSIKGSLGGAEEAAGGAQKGLRRMIEEAGTIREAQRISQGFFDIFLGGGRTIQGTAEIMRFFIATAADINPIFATLAVLGASIAVVAGRQSEHNATMGDGKKRADDLADSLSHLAKSISDDREQDFDAILKGQAAIIDGDDRQLKAAQTYTQEIKNQAEAQKELMRAKEAASDAELGLTIAGLEAERRSRTAGRPQDKLAIDDDIDNRELEARQKRAQDKAQAQVAAAARALNDLNAQIAAKGAELAQEQKKLDELKQNQAADRDTFLANARESDERARSFFAANGVVPVTGEDGKPTGQLTGIDPHGRQTDDLIGSYEKTISGQQAELTQLRGAAIKTPFVNEAIKKIEAALGINTRNLSAMREGLTDIESLPEAEKHLGPLYGQQQKEIEDLQQRMASARAEFDVQRGTPLDTAALNLQTAKTNQDALSKTLANARDDQFQKQREAQATENLRRQREEVENKLKTLPPRDIGGRAELVQQLANAQAVFDYLFKNLPPDGYVGTHDQFNRDVTAAGIASNPQDPAALAAAARAAATRRNAAEQGPILPDPGTPGTAGNQVNLPAGYPPLPADPNVRFGTPVPNDNAPRIIPMSGTDRDTVAAADSAIDAAVRAHPELTRSLQGIGYKSAKLGALMVDLAGATNAADQKLWAALADANRAIARLESATKSFRSR
jgi:hypothetical protein